MLHNLLFSSTASRNLSDAHLANDPTSSLVTIPVEEKGKVSAYLHTPPSVQPPPSSSSESIKQARAAGGAAGAILVSGVGGGVSGPTGMYLSLATRLAHVGVYTLRMDYRYPGHTHHCAKDMRAAMHMLAAQFGVTRFALVGWSFGSAPVFTLAESLNDSDEHLVKAIAVIAPQTANAFGIRHVAPAPVLLVHGTGDKCLSPQCSVQLKQAYDTSPHTAKVVGDGKEAKCEVALMQGDDHCLRRTYAEAETRIFRFLLDGLGIAWQDQEGGDKSMVPSGEVGVEWMRKGHDLDTLPTGEHEAME